MLSALFRRSFGKSPWPSISNSTSVIVTGHSSCSPAEWPRIFLLLFCDFLHFAALNCALKLNTKCFWKHGKVYSIPLAKPRRDDILVAKGTDKNYRIPLGMTLKQSSSN